MSVITRKLLPKKKIKFNLNQNNSDYLDFKFDTSAAYAPSMSAFPFELAQAMKSYSNTPGDVTPGLKATIIPNYHSEVQYSTSSRSYGISNSL